MKANTEKEDGLGGGKKRILAKRAASDKRYEDESTKSSDNNIIMNDPSTVEAMLVSKIAEIQLNAMKSDEKLQNIDRIRSIASVTVTIDDSQLCREFDTEVIDERKSPDERIKAVRELFVQKIKHINELRNDDVLLEKACKALIKEKRTMLADIGSMKKEMVSIDEIKTKLQDICRLLQKQNKDLSEENERISALEKKRLEELATKFQTTITDINTRLSSHDEDQQKQISENTELQGKVDQFQGHFKLKEEHFGTQMKAKTLEMQVYEAKADQAIHMEQHEMAKAAAAELQVKKMIETEKELRAQLELYSSKFVSFDDALNKSNSMFSHFQDKMDKMSRKIKKMEKEKARLQRSIQRHGTETAEEPPKRVELQRLLEESKEERQRLQHFCRTLQLERTEVSKHYSAVVPPSYVPEETEAETETETKSDTTMTTAAAVPVAANGTEPPLSASESTCDEGGPSTITATMTTSGAAEAGSGRAPDGTGEGPSSQPSVCDGAASGAGAAAQPDDARIAFEDGDGVSAGRSEQPVVGSEDGGMDKGNGEGEGEDAVVDLDNDEEEDEDDDVDVDVDELMESISNREAVV